MSADHATDIFVGREKEMAELTAALDDALAGRGRLVMLVGEPGIGKTRTAEEFAAMASTRGAEVLWGRCPEERDAPPYWPWTQVINGFCADREAAVLEATFGDGSPYIAQIAPGLARKLPGLPAPSADSEESARYRLYDFVAGCLRAAAQARPLVLIIDNLHWADASSLRLLEYNAQESSAARLLFIGTYRDTDVSRGHPLHRVL